MYWALHVLINIIGFLVSVLIQHHNWQSVIIFPPAVRQRNGNNKQDQRRRSPTIQIQFEAITSTNATAATHEEGRMILNGDHSVPSRDLLFKVITPFVPIMIYVATVKWNMVVLLQRLLLFV